MKWLRFLIASIMTSTMTAFAADPSPITPAEAAKKVDEKVVVEMEVKSSGGNRNQYLNSEADYEDEKNFTIFISKDHLDRFKKAGIESPAKHYLKKVIRVSGTVVLEQKKPRIVVTEPKQITIVEKEKKS